MTLFQSEVRTCLGAFSLSAGHAQIHHTLHYMLTSQYTDVRRTMLTCQSRV